MRVLVFEPNLFWSTRIMQSLKALGHQARLVRAIESVMEEDRVALVNLGAPEAKVLVEGLKGKGLYVIGHAGHKEVGLRSMGIAAGCDRIASNSEVTFKIGQVLAEISPQEYEV